MIRAVVILGLCAALVAGCGPRKDRLSFDGQYFRAKVSKIEKDRQRFNVTIKPASISLKGALEAGRYEATRYCIVQYGNSAIDWVLGPDQEPGTYTIVNDQLVLSGVCEG